MAQFCKVEKLTMQEKWPFFIYHTICFLIIYIYINVEFLTSRGWI